MEKELKLLNNIHAYVRETERQRRGAIMGGLATLADDPEIRLVCALRDLNQLVIQVMKGHDLTNALTNLTSGQTETR
jgi:hypothetical protein